jgi:hypothetical protein
MLTETKMRQALTALDHVVNRKFTLIVGGGGAMVLAHKFPLATYDIDAIPKDLAIDDLDPFIKIVAEKLKIPVDWLNPYYSAFTSVLPEDYETRLIEVFGGKNLTALALGKEDLLIMKCFAHRAKDIPHARALVRAGANHDIVEDQFEKLKHRSTKGCAEAIEFFDHICDLEEPSL